MTRWRVSPQPRRDHAWDQDEVRAWHLLAETFDEDPFAILAWRGREREDLLANLQAARSEGRPAADRAEPPGRPLTDCLDSYFIRQADVPSPSPRVTLSTALLDQLPDVVVGVRGRPLAEILRPAYAALREGEVTGDRPVG